MRNSEEIQEIMGDSKTAIPWLERRLEDAVRTHDALPAVVRHKIKGMFDCFPNVPKPDESLETPFDANRYADAAAITRMDEVMQWLREIPLPPNEKRVAGKVLFLRSRIIGDRNMSWRKIGHVVGISHDKANYVYDSAIYKLLAVAREAMK